MGKVNSRNLTVIANSSSNSSRGLKYNRKNSCDLHSNIEYCNFFRAIKLTSNFNFKAPPPLQANATILKPPCTGPG